MYLDYFSLERHPFRITPDTSLFYSGGNQGRGVVLEAMLFAVENGEGILKVVGEVGSGKTMLCRMLEERLPDSTEVVYLANPNLSPEEILYAVAFELKLPVRRDTSKLLVMQQLQNHLLKQHAANKRVLVIIEEAQGMPVETLEEIRLFSNLETHRDKLMQIVLFGQPELDKNLSEKHIRQLRERITHSFYLNPLNTKETGEYIRFRISAAGSPCPQLLTTGAEWLISKAAGGLTRRVNILADKSLLAAYADNVIGDDGKIEADMAPVVTWRHVYAAIRDSDYSVSLFEPFYSPLRLISASMLVAVAMMTFLLWPRSTGIASQLPLQDFAPVLQEIAVEQLDAEVDEAQLIPPSYENSPSLPVQEVIFLDEESIVATTSQESVIADVAELEDGIDAAESLGEEQLTELAEIDNSDFESPLVEFNSSLAGIEVSPSTESQQIAAVNIYTEEADTFAAEYSTVTPIDSNSEASANNYSRRSLTQERVLASIPWLRDSDKSGYTIQFISGATDKLKTAEDFLEELGKSGLVSDSYVCMSTAGNSSYWTIKYGNFAGLSEANNFMGQLPVNILDYKPFVQNMSSVECNTNNTIAALILE